MRPDSKISEAIELLKQAKKPYIIAGGGIHYSEAWDELENFAEQFGIPVGETHAGRGSIRNASDILFLDSIEYTLPLSPPVVQLYPWVKVLYLRIQV